MALLGSHEADVWICFSNPHARARIGLLVASDVRFEEPMLHRAATPCTCRQRSSGHVPYTGIKARPRLYIDTYVHSVNKHGWDASWEAWGGVSWGYEEPSPRDWISKAGSAAMHSRYRVMVSDGSSSLQFLRHETLGSGQIGPWAQWAGVFKPEVSWCGPAQSLGSGFGEGLRLRRGRGVDEWTRRRYPCRP